MASPLPTTLPRKTGRPSVDDAQALTDRIVDVATSLFFGNGFEATSLERIARDAGVSKRTLYSRFESKSDLFRAVIDRYTTRNVRTIVPLQDPSASCIDQLIHICIQTLGFTLSPNVIALERVMMAEAERFPELAVIVHDYAMSHLMDPTRQILQKGMADGEILQQDVNTMITFLCDALIISHVRKTALCLEPPGLTDEKRDDVARRLRLLFRGLAGTPQSP